MRICFLGDGSSVHILRWINFFKKRNHDTHLITFSNADIEGVKVHKVGNLVAKQEGGNWQYIKSISEIKRLIKAINPDIINAHYVTSYGFLAALSNFRPLVVTAWGSDILVTPKKNLAYKFITKFALNKADLITSDSYYMTDEIKKLTKTRSITVPMGVEKDLCFKERTQRNNEPVILSLRTVNKNSNIDIIVKAFSILVKDKGYKDARLIIANDGPEMGNIKYLIEQSGIKTNVEIKGFVTREELLNLLLSANLYVSIPTSDSTSVTLLEAMACGITSIVSDIPANNEWIQDGINGLVLRQIKDDKLAELMEKVLKDDRLIERSESFNRNIILKRAIWQENMEFVEKE